MRNYTYDFEIQTMVTMFISAMDDIVVKRYNKEKVAEDKIKVRFVYAPKQRVLNDLLNKAQNIQLPVVAVSIGGINRDPNRVFNKIEGSYIPSVNSNFLTKLFQPVPIDLTLNLTILTRYQEDYDQIVTNFLPYFDPYIIISWRTPSMKDQEIRSQVIWSGSINTLYPDQLQNTQVARIQGETSFIFKGWMFKSRPVNDTAKIYTATTDTSTLANLSTKYSIEQIDNTTTSRSTLSAQPQPRGITPYFTTTSASDLFTVFGKSFFDVRNVYVSGGGFPASTFINPFSSVPGLSADYPGFNAIRVKQYSSNNDDTLTFVMPSATVPGRVDLIIENEAGYGTLTKYSYKNTYNPLVPVSEYTNYQSPFITGIDVRPIN